MAIKMFKEWGDNRVENQDGFPRWTIFCITFVIFDQITFLYLRALLLHSGWPQQDAWPGGQADWIKVLSRTEMTGWLI